LPDSEAKQKNKNESGDEHLFAARQFKHPSTIARFPERARAWFVQKADPRAPRSIISLEESPPEIFCLTDDRPENRCRSTGRTILGKTPVGGRA